MIHSYPSIYNAGHRALQDFLSAGSKFTVQEKIDGSQLSFKATADGAIHARSKGCAINLDAPEEMFRAAVASILSLSGSLTPGWTYRGEYLRRPHHNTICYDRVPRNHIILFDIDRGSEDYMDHGSMAEEAARIGLEPVPCLYSGALSLPDDLAPPLDSESCLGGGKIEGVVVKAHHAVYGPDKKPLIMKVVSEAFREVHKTRWKTENPSSSDIVASLAEQYRTEARWVKACQHLEEAGELSNADKDIGLLLPEVVSDVKSECGDEIRDKLFAYAWPTIKRGIVRGFAEWYKERLRERAKEGA